MPLKIEEMFVFIAHEADGEGVPAYKLGNMMMPLVGADRERVASLRTLAQEVADVTGCKITLARFTTREDLEEIKPTSKQ